MRTLLAIIAALALLSFLSSVRFLVEPSAPAPTLEIAALQNGVRMLSIVTALGTFVVFVVAGSMSAALDYLIHLRRQAEKQTALLEEIARNTRPPGTPSPASAVQYRIPGINK